ncbi:immunity protein [Erwinia pyri]|uniref:Immunity protein n=1 Tax=Erwinia pyri TaxID=3062598 RepID=A0AA50HNV2_9GAMM|nr:immunity protein [Erwinia sp. DE2]WLS80556.1 immunity protein [Erwinia sp. DE2]
MFENESVEDVVVYLMPEFSYQDIDRWFVRYKFEVIANGLLLRTTEKLLKEGKLAKNEKGHIIRGYNW